MGGAGQLVEGSTRQREGLLVPADDVKIRQEYHEPPLTSVEAVEE